MYFFLDYSIIVASKEGSRKKNCWKGRRRDQKVK